MYKKILNGTTIKRGVAITMAAMMVATGALVQEPNMGKVYAYSSPEKNILYNKENGALYNILNDGTCILLKGVDTPGNVTISNQVTYKGKEYTLRGIDGYAFENCNNITGVQIPASVQFIGDGAFRNCKNLTSVDIPEGVSEIASGAFVDCPKLKQLRIPNSVVKLGYFECYDSEYDNTFDICNSDCLIICTESSVIEKYAKEHNLKYITPKLLESGTVLDNTSNACKVKIVKDYEHGATVSYVGTTNSSATDVTIPATVEIDKVVYKVVCIEEGAFSENKNITKVTIGKNIITIGNNAFLNCSQLKSMVINSDKVTVGTNAIKGTNKGLVIKVPSGKVDNFKTYFKGKGNNTVTINNTGKAANALELGNTTGNLHNFAAVVESGDWIYYVDNSCIYKKKKDGTETKCIVKNIGSAFGLNVEGDYLYYTRTIYSKGDSYTRLYRVKLDGTGNKRICSSSIGIYPGGSPTVQNGWIYFCDFSTNLYKVKVDGSKKILLQKGNYGIVDFSIYGKNIYFAKDNCIYRMDINGKSKKILKKCSKSIDGIQVYNGWIYYKNQYGYGNKGSIYRMKLDGKENKEIIKNVLSFNVSDGVIYYSIRDKGSYIADINGKNVKKISKYDFVSFFVLENEIYVEYIDYYTYRYKLKKGDTKLEAGWN